MNISKLATVKSGRRDNREKKEQFRSKVRAKDIKISKLVTVKFLKRVKGFKKKKFRDRSHR